MTDKSTTRQEKRFRIYRMLLQVSCSLAAPRLMREKVHEAWQELQRSLDVEVSTLLQQQRRHGCCAQRHQPLRLPQAHQFI